MPMRPPRPCTAPGCPALVQDGSRCTAHRREERQQQDARRGTAAERGYDSRWRKIRRLVLFEEPLCRQCKAEGRLSAAKHVDHIVPKSRGGTDDRSNLQPLCTSHHSAKTVREDGGFGNRRAIR